MGFYLCGLLTITTSYGQKKKANETNTLLNLTQYVDPYIGSSFHGHVFVGANVPFGAVQLGPVNITQGWDWGSGYHYSDSAIIGFSHTHLSGTGIGDLGDILFMPSTGSVKVKKGNLSQPEGGYYSLFSHNEETVRTGYYAVRLQRTGIKAELTATERVGFHQYTFPVADNPHIVVDLQEGIGWDRAIKTEIKQINDTTITGYRYSKGWASDQRIYFAAIFSKPIQHFSVYEDSVLKEGTSLTGHFVKAVARFSLNNNEKVLVKMGISPVSTENALYNINAELPHWNFHEIVKQADNAWNRELNKVQIKTEDIARKRTFYTALYHTMIAPSIFNDANGDYLGTDKKVYKKAPFTNYTTFSLWDTYRGAHPFFTILHPERVNDMINSMLAIYQQQGKLPVWHLMANETNTMPGHSGVQVVADAYLKGFRGFDTLLAWEAVKATAMQNQRGLKYLKKYGYLSLIHI